MKVKCWFFEKINKIDKSLTRLIRGCVGGGSGERKRSQIKSEMKEKLQLIP